MGSISAAAAVISAVSAVGSAGLQISAAEKQKKAMEREAEQKRIETMQQEARYRKEAESIQAQQRVGYAKAGVQAEGTPLLVGAEQAELAELEALAIRNAGYGTATNISAAGSEAASVGAAGAFGTVGRGASSTLSQLAKK